MRLINVVVISLSQDMRLINVVVISLSQDMRLINVVVISLSQDRLSCYCSIKKLSAVNARYDLHNHMLSKG